MKKKAIIIGAYGFGNLGDEAVLLSTLNFYKKKLFDDFVVISYQPKETSQLYKVKSVHFLSPLVIYHILTSSHFIQGGGGILDSNVAGITNNLARYILMTGCICKLLRKNLIFHRVGFYVFGHKLYNDMLRFILNGSKITCRDELSFNNFQKLGVKSKILMKNDATLELDIEQIDKALNEKWHNKISSKKTIKVGLSIRYVADHNQNEKIKKVIQNALDFFGAKVEFYFLTFQEHKIKRIENDSAIALEIIENRKIQLIRGINDPYEMLAIIKNFDLMIAMRLHANIFAHLQDVILITISYHDKVRAFMEQVAPGQKIIDIEELTSKKIIELINEKL